MKLCFLIFLFLQVPHGCSSNYDVWFGRGVLHRVWGEPQYHGPIYRRQLWQVDRLELHAGTQCNVRSPARMVSLVQSDRPSSNKSNAEQEPRRPFHVHFQQRNTGQQYILLLRSTVGGNLYLRLLRRRVCELWPPVRPARIHRAGIAGGNISLRRRTGADSRGHVRLRRYVVCQDWARGGKRRRPFTRCAVEG
jgi:hypothetical protein